METEYSPSPAGAPDGIEEAQQRIGGEEHHLSMAWSEASAGGWKPGGAACFDREPRSLTSLPERETEEKLWWATPLTAQ